MDHTTTEAVSKVLLQVRHCEPVCRQAGEAKPARLTGRAGSSRPSFAMTDYPLLSSLFRYPGLESTWLTPLRQDRTTILFFIRRFPAALFKYFHNPYYVA